MNTLLALIISLTITAPAWALDYTGSTTIDLTTLTFSGVPVSLFPSLQITQAHTVFGEEDTGPTLIDRAGVWPDHVLATSISNQGSAFATVDTSQMFASISAGDAHNVFADVSRSWTLQVSQPGALTMTVQYTMHHAGVPTTLEGLGTFLANGGAVVFLGNELAKSQQGITTNGDEHGTLRVTRQMVPGERVNLNVYAGENYQYQSVPVPGMLWPTTFLGLAGLGWLWVREWRRGR